MNNSMTRKPAAIIEALRRFYGAAPERAFTQLEAIHGRRPYDAVVAELPPDAEDITDLNDDVSLGIVIRGDGPSVVVRMSYVGPYAIVVLDDGRNVTPSTGSESRLLVQVEHVLVSHGFVLTSSELAGLRLALWKGEAAQSIYGLLFVNGDAPPFT